MSQDMKFLADCYRERKWTVGQSSSPKEREAKGKRERMKKERTFVGNMIEPPPFEVDFPHLHRLLNKIPRFFGVPR